MAERTASIDIDAAPEVVFDYLVTDAGMTAWMGQRAALDARVGGRFEVDIAGWPIRGRYLVVDRPRRVVVGWGVLESDDLPPGASTVEFVLVPTSAGTRVEVTHSGLPASRAETHAAGWRHFLPRLAAAAAGAPEGDDPWEPPTGRGGL